MAIARVNMGSVLLNGAASGSVTVTVGTGAERALIVTIGNRNGSRFIGTLTYAGTSLTRISGAYAGGTTGVGCDAWYMVNPPSGANTLAYSTNDGGTMQCRLVFADYTGVHQTDPLAAGTVGGVSKTGASGLVSSGASGYGQTWSSSVADVVLQDGFCHESSAASTMTAQTNRTQIASVDDGLYNTGGSYTLTSGTGSFAKTWNNGTSDNYGHVIVALKPSSGAGTTTPVNRGEFFFFS